MPGFRFLWIDANIYRTTLPFRDEAAVLEWRRLESHRKAQSRGREGVFEDYRLRVADVLRDYGMTARDEAPQDSRQLYG